MMVIGKIWEMTVVVNMIREINYDLIPREGTQVLEKEWISSWLPRSIL
jgi:hypothetical protein